ncbi:membrane-spanning 4-domains subfamily A member 8-like isoform X2 [Pongo pygmaeus]|uniref:Uncharacterized protein n=1 Tax=Pongo abelii TaxID=9601 RepID=A0A8I5T6S1_PONAB|nr:membrane-spanning 4-domains subfamily A member 8 isoform X2 [Pongo abelii]
MPSSHIVLKEETRMLGAAQIIIGLIHCALGKTWIHLYINQSTSFSTIYLPIVFMSGFPFLASSLYVISGIFAIAAEKKRSPRLLMYAIWMNLNSFGCAIIGLLLIACEIILFLTKDENIQWPHKSGIMLSMYLWVFSTLELILANTVTRWIKKANHHDNNTT